MIAIVPCLGMMESDGEISSRHKQIPTECPSYISAYLELKVTALYTSPLLVPVMGYDL